eukprot:10877362-Ditylum_brightwellii.AAC.1
MEEDLMEESSITSGGFGSIFGGSGVGGTGGSRSASGDGDGGNRFGWRRRNSSSPTNGTSDYETIILERDLVIDNLEKTAKENEAMITKLKSENIRFGGRECCATRTSPAFQRGVEEESDDGGGKKWGRKER